MSNCLMKHFLPLNPLFLSFKGLKCLIYGVRQESDTILCLNYGAATFMNNSDGEDKETLE